MNLFPARLTVAPRQLVTLVSFAMASLCANAQAEDAGKMLSLSGFGTAGVVHSTNNKGDFTADAYEVKGARYNDATSGGAVREGAARRSHLVRQAS